jgi:hypothetical protein
MIINYYQIKIILIYNINLLLQFYIIMGVGYIQLLFVGSETNIFNYNPNISFFKTYYRRYSNFFINNMVIQGNDISLNLTNNLVTNVISFNIPKDGDLLSKTYLELTFGDFFFELFNYDNELFSTLNTDILNFYDSYYIKANNYNIDLIKQIDIVKINYTYMNNYLDNNEDQNIFLTIQSSNILRSDLLIQEIKNNQFVRIQRDPTKIFYNINLTLKFYSFVVDLIAQQDIKNNALFNFLYFSYYLKDLTYIQIDFKQKNISLKILYSNTLYYETIIQLLYSNIFLIKQIQIETNNIYYSCNYETNLFNNIMELFLIQTKKIDIEIIKNKLKATKISINNALNTKLSNLILNKQENTSIYLTI